MTIVVIFTPAQDRIARLLAAGASTPRIAQAIGCSFHTVRAHIRIMALRVPGEGPSTEKVRHYAQERYPEARAS